ncbi:phage major capsid protein [Elioraea sp.]|uniref:phage major capsid protein n=1 Tax=Elioraea sp. TaxID=2185103 RepID=UPI003F7233BD
MADAALAAALRHRRAPAAPRSLDKEGRTVEVTASSFAAVARDGVRPDASFGRWIERLDPGGLALAASLPVLADHQNDTTGLIGTVESTRVADGKLHAKVRFANVPRADEILNLIEGGALSGVSLGYTVEVYQHTGERNGAPVFTATQWTVRELSFVPIPADPEARVRSADPVPAPREEGAMPDTIMPNPPASGTDDQTRAERGRITAIDQVVSRVADSIVERAVAEELRTRAVKDGLTAEQFSAAVLEAAIEKGKTMTRRTPQPVQQIGESGADPAVIRTRMAEALQARVTGGAVSESAREFRGMSLAAMAAELLEARGERVARNAAPSTIITRALTTSDFPLLLQETAARELQNRLEVAPGAARMVCAMREARDFRPGKFLQAAGPTDLHHLPEGAEIQHAPPHERGESYQVATWARNLWFTRQALVNDDLGAFDQVRLFAGAVVATEAAEFVRMFATNGGGWGPTLTDGDPLFHTNHLNVGSGAVGTAGISAGRIVMRGQKDAAGNLIAPEPRIILTGPAGETAAEQALNEIATVSTDESNRPVFAGRLRLAVEPRLAGAPWFLFGDPAVAPVIAMVTLLGSGGLPVITQHDQANRDGLVFKLVHDFTFAPMSFVGAVRLTGS